MHGGLGFIEQTGVAQLYRDARIAPIYEGTNGIQANDLVGRKLMRDGGASARAFFAKIRAVAGAASGGGPLPQIGSALGQGLEALEQATHWLIETWPKDKRLALSGATPYLQLFGLVTGAFLLTRQAEAAQAHRNGADRAFLDGKSHRPPGSSATTSCPPPPASPLRSPPAARARWNWRKICSSEVVAAIERLAKLSSSRKRG